MRFKVYSTHTQSLDRAVQGFVWADSVCFFFPPQYFTTVNYIRDQINAFVLFYLLGEMLQSVKHFDHYNYSSQHSADSSFDPVTNNIYLENFRNFWLDFIWDPKQVVEIWEIRK